MASQTLIIFGRLAGLNEIVSANRKNRYMGANMKRENQDRIIEAIKVCGINRITKPIDVHILWVEPNCRRDHDNVAAGKKFILDGLVEAGIIKNDSPAFVRDMTDRFRVSREMPRIEVTLEERES